MIRSWRNFGSTSTQPLSFLLQYCYLQTWYIPTCDSEFRKLLLRTVCAVLHTSHKEATNNFLLRKKQSFCPDEEYRWNSPLSHGKHFRDVHTRTMPELLKTSCSLAWRRSIVVRYYASEESSAERRFNPIHLNYLFAWFYLEQATSDKPKQRYAKVQAVLEKCCKHIFEFFVEVLKRFRLPMPWSAEEAQKDSLSLLMVPFNYCAVRVAFSFFFFTFQRSTSGLHVYSETKICFWNIRMNHCAYEKVCAEYRGQTLVIWFIGLSQAFQTSLISLSTDALAALES